MASVRFAPSWLHGLRRVALVLVASALVSAAVYAVNGAPSSERQPQHVDDVYGPTMPFGLVQFVGQGLMLAAVVYAARRWFKVRL